MMNFNYAYTVLVLSEISSVLANLRTKLDEGSGVRVYLFHKNQEFSIRKLRIGNWELGIE